MSLNDVFTDVKNLSGNIVYCQIQNFVDAPTPASRLRDGITRALPTEKLDSY